MLDKGLKPDEYTFNALLTSMARVGTNLFAVQDIVGEMNKWGVKVGCRFGQAIVAAFDDEVKAGMSNSPLELLFGSSRLDLLP